MWRRVYLAVRHRLCPGLRRDCSADAGHERDCAGSCRRYAELAAAAVVTFLSIFLNYCRFSTYLKWIA